MKNANPSITKQKILDSAVKVLNRKEYHECLVDEIAAAAGVAKGTIYLYFKSKEELYVSLLIRMIHEMRDIVDSLRGQSLPAQQQLRQLLHRLHDFIAEHQHVLLMLKEQTRPSAGSSRNQLRRAFEDLIASMSAIVREGIQEKKLKKYPPVLISSVIFSALTAVVRCSGKRGAIDEKISAELITDILLRGIERNS